MEYLELMLGTWVLEYISQTVSGEKDTHARFNAHAVTLRDKFGKCSVKSPFK